MRARHWPSVLAGLRATAPGLAWTGIRRAAFLPIFREVTPIDVIERSADRLCGGAPRGEWHGLRAASGQGIPPGSQVAPHAAGLVRAGTGLEFARGERGLTLLRTCYRGWPFFRTLIDDIEAMLARSDFAIVAYYDRLVAPELRSFSGLVREEYERGCREVLQIKESTRSARQRLARYNGDIALRNAYLDPLHCMQVDLLERWRASGRQMRELLDALQASVSGIARGLQSTG